MVLKLKRLALLFTNLIIFGLPIEVNLQEGHTTALESENTARDGAATREDETTAREGDEATSMQIETGERLASVFPTEGDEASTRDVEIAVRDAKPLVKEVEGVPREGGNTTTIPTIIVIISVVNNSNIICVCEVLVLITVVIPFAVSVLRT